jgi:hypothetical protein
MSVSGSSEFCRMAINNLQVLLVNALPTEDLQHKQKMQTANQRPAVEQKYDSSGTEITKVNQ